MLVAHALLFGGISIAFSFWVSSLSTSEFSFSSSKDPLSEDTTTFEEGTKDFLPHKPSFLQTNCI